MNFFQTLHTSINLPWLDFLSSFTQNQFLSFVIFYMADIPIFIIPIFLVGWWIWYNFHWENDKKYLLLFVFYSMIVAISISLFIQQFVEIDRPENSIIHAERLILEHIPDASFPSDHTSVSGAFLLGLFLFGWRRLSLLFTPFFLIMLLSRIAGWLHWPLDIFIWLIVWGLSAFFIYKIQKISILGKINTTLIKIAKYFKL